MSETRKKRLTPKQIKRIVRKASPNLTCNEIAERVGLAYSQVLPVLKCRRIAYKHKWFKRDDDNRVNCQSWLTDEQKATIKSLAAPNKAASEIAKVVKSSPQRVRDFLEINGLPFKPQIAGGKTGDLNTNGLFNWESSKAIDTLFFAA